MVESTELFTYKVIKQLSLSMFKICIFLIRKHKLIVVLGNYRNEQINRFQKIDVKLFDDVFMQKEKNIQAVVNFTVM